MGNEEIEALDDASQVFENRKHYFELMLKILRDDMESIENIKDIRKKSGDPALRSETHISWGELAEVTKIEVDTLRSYIGGGKSVPKIQNVVKIAISLRADVYFLFGLYGIEVVYPTPRTAKSILLNLYRVSRFSGIRVKRIRDISNEMYIYSDEDYINAFLERIDLSKDVKHALKVIDGLLEEGRIERSLFEVNRNLEFVLPEEDVVIIFRQRLKEVIDKGVSLKQLEQLSNIEARTLEGYIKDDEPTEMTINNAIQIAFSLNIDLNYLLGLSNEKKPFPIHKAAILINLFKVLKFSNFKLQEVAGKKVAVSRNEVIFQFFGLENKMQSITDALEIAEHRCEGNHLWVVHGEIQMYDYLLERSGFNFMRFIIDNDLYNAKINELDKFDRIRKKLTGGK